MEGKIILLDTNILIDYFRKTNKQNSLFHKLSDRYRNFCISVITHFEILRGSNRKQELFWDNILKYLDIVSYIPMMNYTALQIRNELKRKRKNITIEDLIIASTALHFSFSLATLNEDHFSSISALELITPSSL